MLASRGKIMDPCPGGRLIWFGAVIIAASIANMAAQHRRTPAFRIEPGREAERVERKQVGVARTERHRDRKGGATLCIAPVAIGRHCGEKGVEVMFVGRGKANCRHQPLLPFAEMEQPLIGIGDELIGIVKRLAVLPAGDDAEPFEQADHPFGLGIGDRQIMCAERISRYGVATAACIATGAVFEFEQAEIGHTRLGQRPGGR